MNSGGHRGFTVVTIITLIFAPFFVHHEWVYRLVGQTTSTKIEQCAPKAPCPEHTVVVNVVRQPIPPGGGGGGDEGGGGDHGGQGGGDGTGGGDHGGHGGGGGGGSGGGDKGKKGGKH